jgi:hypothetical protein
VDLAKRHGYSENAEAICDIHRAFCLMSQTLREEVFMSIAMRRAFTAIGVAAAAGLMAMAVATGSGMTHHSLASNGVINTDGIQGSGAIILTDNGVIHSD